MTTEIDAELNAETEVSQFHFLSILRMLWKHKWLIVVVWAVGSTISISVVRALPPIYRAQAVILVDSQKIPQTFVSPTVGGDVPDRLALITQTIMTSARLIEIVDAFHLYSSGRQRWTQDELLDHMRQDISVQFEKSWTGDQMHAFRLSYQGDNATTVAQVTNRLASLYVAENSRAREHQAEDTVEFLRRQLQAAKASLDEQEGKVARFKQQHAGALPEQENSLLGTLSSLSVELQGRQAELDRAQEKKLSLTAALSDAESSEAILMTNVSRVSGGAEAAPTPKSEILKEELRSLRARYTSRHPDVQEMERQVAQAEREEAEEARVLQAAASALPERLKGGRGGPERESVTVPPQLLQARERVRSIRTQLESAGHEIQSIEQQQKQLLDAIAECKVRINKLPLVEQEMAALKRNYEESANNYNSLLQKQLAAGVATDMERSQNSERFTVVEPARPPQKPEKPKRLQLAGMGICGSLVIAVLATLALEGRNRTVLGEWELPPGTAILGRVPVIDMATLDVRSDHI